MVVEYIPLHVHELLLHVVDAFHLIYACPERTSAAQRCADLLQDYLCVW